jgi:hypothetical protein
MTFTTDGLTDTGTDPETAAAALETLADVIAVNCSTGPDAMTAVVETMARTTRKPIGVQPNAGLPVQREGRTVFPLSAEEVAAFGPKFVEAGATLVGGCCGTTPAYIRLLARTIKGRPAAPRAVPGGVKITSRMKTAWIGPGLSFLKIGEKINPTGKKAFAEAIREGRLDMIVAEARKQYSTAPMRSTERRRSDDARGGKHGAGRDGCPERRGPAARHRFLERRRPGSGPQGLSGPCARQQRERGGGEARTGPAARETVRRVRSRSRLRRRHSEKAVDLGTRKI